MNEAVLSIDADPSKPEVVERLYDWYELMREKAPVHYIEPLKVYFVSRYQDVVDCLFDPDTFSAENAHENPIATVPVLPGADNPRHDVQRRLIARSFTPKGVQSLSATVQKMADDLVDQFAADGKCDLVDRFAHPYPLRVIAHIFGVPHDAKDFRRWSDAMFAAAFGASEDQMVAAFEVVDELGQWVRGLADERREMLRAGKPLPNDLLTTFVTPGEDGEVLTTEEFVVASLQLLNGGHETTTKLIANTLYLLMTHPDQLQAVRQKPELMRGAIEESLRCESPAQGEWRRTTRDVTLHGVHIPADSRLYLGFASGNRDPRVFTDPQRFDIQRPPTEVGKHLALGRGMHVCLGAHLARMDAAIALNTLLRRLPNLRMDPERKPRPCPLHWMRGYEELHVLWDAVQR